MRFSELMSECDCMLQFLPAKSVFCVKLSFFIANIGGLYILKFSAIKLVTDIAAWAPASGGWG